MSEASLMKHIMLAVSKAGAVLFRNNQGRGVLGQFQKAPSGEFIVRNGRVVDFGVCNPGGSDLIGWRTLTVTEDMVGKQVAIFLAMEIKTPAGRATKEQVHFIEQVRKAGGIAGIARSVDDAVGLF